MTFLEKYKQDTHQFLDVQEFGFGCPCQYGYETRRSYGSYCKFTTCRDCWNRQMDESTDICTTNHNTNNEREETTTETTTTRKTKARLLEEIDILKKQVANLDKYKQYDNFANELAAIRESFVKVGFSETEAFQIILTTLRGGR